MQTARFAKVVAEAGKPVQHLRLVPLPKDTVLQKAERANRVLTIHQQTVGTKTDYGTVGLADDTSAQVLIFPHSLRSFEGKRIIGIDYSLFSEAPALAPPKPKEQTPRHKAAKPAKRQSAAKPAKAEKPEPVAKGRAVTTAKPKAVAKPPPSNVVDFHSRSAKNANHEPPDLPDAVRDQIRKAMAELEQGKHVAAYRLLSQIVDD